MTQSWARRRGKEDAIEMYAVRQPTVGARMLHCTSSLLQDPNGRIQACRKHIGDRHAAFGWLALLLFPFRR